MFNSHKLLYLLLLQGRRVLERVRPLTTLAIEVDLSRQTFRRMQKRPILQFVLDGSDIEALDVILHANINIVPFTTGPGRGRAHGTG